MKRKVRPEAPASRISVRDRESSMNSIATKLEATCCHCHHVIKQAYLRLISKTNPKDAEQINRTVWGANPQYGAGPNSVERA